MKIIEINPLSETGWDERLPPDLATPFHGTAWLRVLHETYGYTPCCLAVDTGGGWQPLLPLMEVSSALTGRRGVSLPFTDFCEPLLPESFPAVLDAARSLGRQRGWSYFEIRWVPATGEPPPRYAEYVGHRLPLDETEEWLLSGCSDGIRRGIRKAEREGVRVREAAGEPDLRAFYRLQEETRHRHGLPPQPYRFFRNLWKHVVASGHGALLLAEWQNRVVAGALFLLDGPRAVFKFGASDKRFQEARPNNLLMWAGILRCRSHGCRELLLGRTDAEQEGLRRFKCGWGAKEYPLGYVRYRMTTESFALPDSRHSAWKNRLLSALPRPAARAIGALLYRHMG